MSSQNHLDPQTLSLLTDDMLTGNEYEQWMKHIDSCPNCATAYEDYQNITFNLVKLETLTPPSDFADTIIANLPPQDSFDPSKSIEIKSSNVKISPIANFPWQQVGLFAACAALAFTFLPQQAPTTLERDSEGRIFENPAQTEQILPVETQDIPSSPEVFTLEDPLPIQEETSLTTQSFFTSFFPQDGLTDKGNILLELDFDQLYQVIQEETGLLPAVLCNFNEIPSDNSFHSLGNWNTIPTQEWVTYQVWYYTPDDQTILPQLLDLFPTLTHQLPELPDHALFLLLAPSNLD